MLEQYTEMPPVRVVLRPLGSPLTIGASGLCMASLVQSGLALHWIAARQSHDVGLILVSVPFLLQLVACLFAYAARDGAMGAAVGILSVNWLAIGLVHLTSKPHARSGALGLLLLAAAALLVLDSCAVGVRKPLPALMIALAGLRFALSGVHQLAHGPGWATAAGVVGLVVVAVSAYCAIAFELEGQLHRPLLPTLRRNPNGESDSARTAVEGITKEAGVRPGT